MTGDEEVKKGDRAVILFFPREFKARVDAVKGVVE